MFEMIDTTNYHCYRVRFKRGSISIEDKIFGTGPFDTICMICDTKADGHPKVVAIGEAHLHPHDHYDRMEGKKIAFGRAIQSWDRNARITFWKFFWTWVNNWGGKSKTVLCPNCGDIITL